MDMMLLRIKLFFHALNRLVYPIFPSFNSHKFDFPQEENDQAFPFAL
jgi:hypothetical protein